MELACYRCGASLDALTLPLARLDVCPDCGVELHVCRMCVSYAPSRPKACTEEDAIEVRDKSSANFCDYFVPSPHAFDGVEIAAEKRARARLGTLFGEDDDARAPAADERTRADRTDEALERAHELFKK